MAIHLPRRRFGHSRAGRVKAATPIANEHERASRAEEVAGGEERDDEQSAVVHPGEDRRQIAGCDVRTEESVQDHDRGGDEQYELEGGPGMTPPEQPAEERPTENVHARGRTVGAQHQFRFQVHPGQTGV